VAVADIAQTPLVTLGHDLALAAVASHRRLADRGSPFLEFV
jgi:hypothetical protein